MPSKLPIITVRVTQEQDELLGVLARFQGRSKASYVRELLDGAEPMFRALVPVLKAHAATIEGQPVAVRDLVSRVLTGAYGDDASPLLDAMQDMAGRLEATEAAGAERTAPQRKRGADRTAPAPSKRKARS